MYAKKSTDKKRPSGWVERRRYFHRLFESLRGKTSKDEENQKIVPVGEKD
jgi:hypothetical protein